MWCAELQRLVVTRPARDLGAPPGGDGVPRRRVPGVPFTRYRPHLVDVEVKDIGCASQRAHSGKAPAQLGGDAMDPAKSVKVDPVRVVLAEDECGLRRRQQGVKARYYLARIAV